MDRAKSPKIRQLCGRVEGAPRPPITTLIVLVIGGLLLAISHALASPLELVMTPEDFEEERVYSPYAGRNYPDEVLFGDTHFHTNLSFDAGLVGTTLTVDEGFRIARGEKVISNSGLPVQLIRPVGSQYRYALEVLTFSLLDPDRSILDRCPGPDEKSVSQCVVTG